MIQRRGNALNAAARPEREESTESGVRGRRVRENVRAKEEGLDPGGGQRRNCREASIKLRGTDNQ